MKINREEEDFRPINVTLESRKEAILFLVLFGSLSSRVAHDILSYAGEVVSDDDPSVELHEKLRRMIGIDLDRLAVLNIEMNEE